MKTELPPRIPYLQASYAELCDHLNKSAELLQRNPGQLDGILANLDPAQHSLGYLAVLVARIGQVSDLENPQNYHFFYFEGVS